MTARGSHRATPSGVEHPGVDRAAAERRGDWEALEALEPSVSDEWAMLARRHHSSRQYGRQIAIDVAVVVVALLIIALLS
jgi:hypothetical protein